MFEKYTPIKPVKSMFRFPEYKLHFFFILSVIAPNRSDQESSDSFSMVKV